MATSDTTTRITPITGRASRRDERVRLIEESVLLIRGEWPALATGLCETINRAAGVVFPTPKTLENAIRETSSESLRLVEQLYGPEASVEVQQLAAHSRDQGHLAREESGRRHRVHLPRPHRRVRAHIG